MQLKPPRFAANLAVIQPSIAGALSLVVLSFMPLGRSRGDRSRSRAEDAEEYYVLINDLPVLSPAVRSLHNKWHEQCGLRSIHAPKDTAVWFIDPMLQPICRNPAMVKLSIGSRFWEDTLLNSWSPLFCADLPYEMHVLDPEYDHCFPDAFAQVVVQQRPAHETSITMLVVYRHDPEGYQEAFHVVALPQRLTSAFLIAFVDELESEAFQEHFLIVDLLLNSRHVWDLCQTEAGVTIHPPVFLEVHTAPFPDWGPASS